MSEHESETPEYRLAQVEANYAFEGISLTPDERRLLLRLFRGEITREQYDAEVERTTFGDATGDGRADGA
ncbi:MAG: hypothetical protein J2P24_05805 [Streptosporangiales bacterium]|nr:hypothetical protein [Streptosporangiales bacterium]MBO0891028.1 hypothetical protein [Acidothermales bacterium]